ncbi:transmembrane protein C5orf28-like protein [Leptotrombidium deliense]|uniref:Transmembrane protein 267 n=1 Tax=Leptotrombidium deliense TaxID=299467 RepID=A0A443SLE8_9ACAR|nr:transmembrane protein C5orf28-like protein [Leptotrombidium deliense]
MFSLLVCVKYISLFGVLVFLNLFGDYLLTLSPVNDKILAFRAVGDNATHGAIAAISWFMVSVLKHAPLFDKTSLTNCSLCLIFACIIDVDHFIAARSFNLKDAVRLNARPPLHCTSVILALILLMFIVAVFFVNLKVITISCLLFVAVITHHLRDALRRGLWIYPFTDELPITYSLYLCLLFVIPLFVFTVHEYFSKTSYELTNRIDNYIV